MFNTISCVQKSLALSFLTGNWMYSRKPAFNSEENCGNFCTQLIGNSFLFAITKTIIRVYCKWKHLCNSLSLSLSLYIYIYIYSVKLPHHISFTVVHFLKFYPLENKKKSHMAWESGENGGCCTSTILGFGKNNLSKSDETADLKVSRSDIAFSWFRQRSQNV